MQLRLLIFATLFAGIALHAQEVPLLDSAKIELDDIEVSFLSSYYVQDGIHSPVTGGRGTEYLTNFAPSINITMPTDTHRVWTIDAGVDFYSSASSDNIDNQFLIEGYRTGASGQDERSYFTIGRKTKPNKTIEYGFMAGGSFEWDVFSFYGGGSIGINSKDNNRGAQLKVNYYYDDWKLIYPAEFRNGAVSYLDTDKRKSLNSSLVLQTNLSQKLSASVAADFVVQNGLLSTPFHRVYFSDRPNNHVGFIEMLPDNRVKYPLGLRLNYHAFDFLILKSFYRYYSDSWGLTAHTFELTTPIKASQAFRFYPFFRRIVQTQADYFAPYQGHLSTSAFFTSDFDLSTFDADKYGMAVSYTPLFGISRFKYKKRAALLKSITLRYAHYDRTDGLFADVVTMSLEFSLKQ